MHFILGCAALLVGIILVVATKATGARAPGLRLAGPALVLLSIVVMITSCVRVVPAGNVGVIDVFGAVAEAPRRAGITLVNPFASLKMLSIKTQEIKETMSVPSKEGMTVQLDVSVLYSLDPEKAPEMYRTVGMNYAEIVLIPQFRSVGRGVTVNYEAKALYTASREQIASQFQEELQGLVGERGITIERVALRDIELPRAVASAIELKLQAEQEAEKMKFILQKEQQEAERKRIEAEGIREFQKIVTEGITTSLLHWKGIEATKALAESPNTKVIIFGNSQTGLPLVFDAQEFVKEGGQ